MIVLLHRTVLPDFAINRADGGPYELTQHAFVYVLNRSTDLSETSFVLKVVAFKFDRVAISGNTARHG